MKQPMQQQVRRLLLHSYHAAQTKGPSASSSSVLRSPLSHAESNHVLDLEEIKNLTALLERIEAKHQQLQASNIHDPVAMELLAQRIVQIKARLQQVPSPVQTGDKNKL